MNKMRYVPAGFEEEDVTYEYDIDEFGDSVQKTCKNMKITVVPDITINAGLNGENFDATLSPETAVWFDSYKNMWNIYKNTPAMIETLHNIFIMSPNPLLLALKLFANCPDCRHPKNNSLSRLIMEEITKFHSKKPEITNLCTDNMRMVAFNFVKFQGIQKLYKSITDVYDLKKLKDIIEVKIQEMIKQHFYKEASQLILALDLIDKFDIFDIAIPLILQDKISLAEDYLDFAKQLQRPTVEFLDSLLEGSMSVSSNCDQYISKYNYNDIKMEKLHRKPLTKLIVRLARKYNLPNDATPYMNHSKMFSYLNYLLYKKYVDKSLSDESWKEMIKDSIALDCKDLQIELISTISFHNDMKEAVYWVEYFNIPANKLPVLVQDYMSSSCKTSDVSVEEACDMKMHHQKKSLDKRFGKGESFYRLKLEESEIVMVNTQVSFSNMIRKLKTESQIAFDSEWKPAFSVSNVISIIQFAIRDRIFLVDALTPDITDDLWISLGKNIFNNAEILKIGFSLIHDLTMFQKALPALNINMKSLTSYLDLQELWKKLSSMPHFHFPYKGSKSGETLSNLVELCFGKQLDKSNQLSNWAKRPLRREQIVYAALDAYCLLDIYDVISINIAQMNIDFNEFIENFIVEINAKMQKSRKKTKNQPNLKTSPTKKETESVPVRPNVKPVKVSEVKIMCDIMLMGLAKSLRKIGLDCTYLPNKEDRENCVRLAVNENRYLLTKGMLFKNFAEHFPLGYCYEVQNDIVNDQVKEVVDHFNIIVEERDVFSRCQICNSNEFILAKQTDMYELKYGDCYKGNKTDTNLIEELPSKSWALNEITSQIKRTGITSKGYEINTSNISDSIIESIYYFYICEGCGKCYWDGSHYGRVLSGFLKDIIRKN